MSTGKARGPAFTKVHHVGILVRDIDKALAELSSLGVGPFETPQHGPPFIKTTFKGQPANFDTKRLVARMGTIEVELFTPVGEAPAMQEFLKTRGDGIHHLSFVVDDLDKEVRQLEEKGVELLESARWEGGGFAYFKKPGGDIVIELLQF
jgi:methylmalonyl-CoA/ethylmalonyl-CoA epimerase